MSLEQDGKPAPDAPLVKLVIFKDDQMWFRYFLPRSNEFGDLPAQFELDPTQKPKRIDQTVDGKTYLGIYDLEGGTLRICWRRTPASCRQTGSSRRIRAKPQGC